MRTAGLGSKVIGDATRFDVLATRTKACRVEIIRDRYALPEVHDLEPLGNGLFTVTVPGVGHGALYELWLDDRKYPDPYARYLPAGVNGPAMVVEPRHAWRHPPGIELEPAERVIYELHIGTFTPEGTFSAATERLADLAELGVTMIELMPVSAFAGHRGWGYDGVAHFATHAAYGTPDDLRRLVDEAHRLGLAVLLDVVYNHFGPAGNYLASFNPDYFSKDIRTAWGDAPDYGHVPMREYVLDNARFWLTEFRFDGLRLDATHTIVDSGSSHILEELSTMAHGLVPRKILIAEDARNDSSLITETGLDAVWADDFHHVAHVTATTEDDGYYGGYEAGAAPIATTLQHGWLHHGQILSPARPSSGAPRGTTTAGVPAEAFVYCLQNHDQVGNRALGERLCHLIGLGRCRALAAIQFFVPMTPLIFMGEEWAASSPFQFFTDHDSDLGALISRGRRDEFKAFKTFSEPTAQERIPDPQAEESFERSKLRWAERGEGDHAGMLSFYRTLLALRRNDRVLRAGSREQLEASARGDVLVCRRWAGPADRLLLANLGDRPLPENEVREWLGDRRVIFRTDDGSSDGSGAGLPAWTTLIAADHTA